MRIYRVEDSEGKGAFQGLVREAREAVAKARGADDFWDTEEPDPYRHPSAYDDRGLAKVYTLVGPGSPWFFGFESMGALARWFDSEAIRVEMARLGGVVVVYEADEAHVHKGEWQLIFLKEKARRVETIAIPTLPTDM